ncbi:hypothetical protein [Nioella nitratireducens]|uniref:hypothetical protein n=1 Tax=Nioella nitratireducens TaxID=1287720 RepID=UPI0008FD32AE|nr:hypothetical protein [Nioella nitratireducens]
MTPAGFELRQFPKQFQGSSWDTQPDFGAFENNGLEGRSGHKNTRRATSSLSHYIKPEHKRMARALGYCLTLGTIEAWMNFRLLSAARLSETERAGLAFAALTTLAQDKAEATAAAAIGSAGVPVPPLFGGMDEARLWASHANRSEIKAYALASFEAMSAQDRAAFFRHIGKKEVAA